MQVKELWADMVTIVGHKFYGPRIGALYHRRGVQVGQELEQELY